ncbi:MAG: HINT domain-containing protein, partial [Acetatifactor sp.]|nr:HINT domain-containing protein [Acetatifactor sp.]
VKVYNFEVEDWHTYYVAELGVLVHNMCDVIPSESGPNNNTKRVYAPTKKHDSRFGWGSKNPIPDMETGQNLLDTAYESSKNKQLYNVYEGKLIKFQPDRTNGWHAYLMDNTATEVPSEVLKKMLQDGAITKVTYNKLIKNKTKK